MKLETLKDLYIHELRDVHSAEKQLTRALPKLAKRASHDALQQAFTDHLAETEEHVVRVEKILSELEARAAGKMCEGMKGLITEGAELLETDGNESVLDSGIIVAAQKCEHYEIAAYGSLCAIAELLGRKQDVKVLSQTLEEEKAADASLSQIAQDVNNSSALTSDR